MRRQTPRNINLAKTFDNLVKWFHDEMIVQKQAPGFLIGLSGTDSLVAFCAAAKALEMAGKGDRMLGVHFAPSEDFLYDHPEAEVHLWFRDQVLPWLTKEFPNAKIVVDTSIDWRCDGLRWGALMDMSVVSNDRKRTMRLPEEQYWVVGTKNRTEELLFTFSNASTAVSLQPLTSLWKTEILQLAEYLGIPQIAIAKSCETDCICGRERLAATHLKEIDYLLMYRQGELAESYIVNNIPTELRSILYKYINNQVDKGWFKINIPYMPLLTSVHCKDPLVVSFEDGSLNLSEFNHYKHLEIAWYYLKEMSLDEAAEKYCRHLQALLEANGQIKRFSLEITKAYFSKLEQAMNQNPTETFEELVQKCPSITSKTSA